MRMVPINMETPKGLLEVEGEPLIERLIRQLHAVKVKEIYVVVGFKKEQYDYLVDQYGSEAGCTSMGMQRKTTCIPWQRYCHSLAKRILCRATSGAGKIRFRSMSGIPGIW